MRGILHHSEKLNGINRLRQGNIGDVLCNQRQQRKAKAPAKTAPKHVGVLFEKKTGPQTQNRRQNSRQSGEDTGRQPLSSMLTMDVAHTRAY
jgi:hypothetical protein